MSRTKKLTRARAREATLREEIAFLEIALSEARKMAISARLRVEAVENELRPHVERIMDIQLNLPAWRFRDDGNRVRTIDPREKYGVCYTIAHQVLWELLRGEHGVRMAEYFQHVGASMLAKAVSDAYVNPASGLADEKRHRVGNEEAS